MTPLTRHARFSIDTLEQVGQVVAKGRYLLGYYTAPEGGVAFTWYLGTVDFTARKIVKIRLYRHEYQALEALGYYQAGLADEKYGKAEYQNQTILHGLAEAGYTIDLDNQACQATFNPTPQLLETLSEPENRTDSGDGLSGSSETQQSDQSAQTRNDDPVGSVPGD